MDSIAICILRRAICILQKFLCNMGIDSKPFLFRRKESMLHRNRYCMHIARCNMHNAIKIAACILRKKKLFFSPVFLSTGNIVGVVRITWGKIWGNNMTNFNETLLEVPKLQKTIPRKADYLPHFAEA